MAKNRIIAHGSETYFFTIRETYLCVCDGNECAAALLDHLQYTHEGIITANAGQSRNQMPFAAERSITYLRRMTFGIWAKNTMTKALSLLNDRGLISVLPSEKGSANTIEFNPKEVQKAVDIAIGNIKIGWSNLNRGVVKFIQGGGQI